jgi:hypothetical protein
LKDFSEKNMLKLFNQSENWAFVLIVNLYKKTKIMRKSRGILEKFEIAVSFRQIVVDFC